MCTVKNLVIKYYHDAELDRELIILDNSKPGVFMWTNKHTGEKYVGCSVFMSKYFDEFLSHNPKESYKIKSTIWEDIYIYGPSGFSLSILMYLDRGDDTTYELVQRLKLERNKIIKLFKPEYNTRNKGK